MFKERLLASLVLIPLFVLLILKLSPSGFWYLTLAMILIGAWEWSSFVGLVFLPQRALYVVILFLSVPVSLFIKTMDLMVISFFFWILALFFVLLYPKASQLWGSSKLIRGLMGIFVLIPCLRSINFIRDNDNLIQHTQGRYLLLFLFVLIWGADIGAYLAGKLWGKTKLAPRVSPGKSWQGCFGALVFTGLIVGIGKYCHLLGEMRFNQLMLLGFLTLIFSILGDLFESMLKRNVALKDSGQLIPGHGGLLDRIDSLTAGAPIFVLTICWLSKSLH